MRYSYKTRGTCSSQIDFDINGDVITNVAFTGGCNGNTQGVASLVDGLTVTQIEDRLKGIQCVVLPVQTSFHMLSAKHMKQKKTTHKYPKYYLETYLQKYCKCQIATVIF